mmetsp:Transcript_60893/g.130909  ORF Transcript_60893/g.130909 Transcript_60893/m.130909 type:complete len:201 (+) Transcript_60893:221-823(+)
MVLSSRLLQDRCSLALPQHLQAAEGFHGPTPRLGVGGEGVALATGGGALEAGLGLAEGLHRAHDGTPRGTLSAEDLCQGAAHLQLRRTLHPRLGAILQHLGDHGVALLCLDHEVIARALLTLDTLDEDSGLNDAIVIRGLRRLTAHCRETSLHGEDCNDDLFAQGLLDGPNLDGAWPVDAEAAPVLGGLVEDELGSLQCL